MSEEIEDLIASIEQKFDSEFHAQQNHNKSVQDPAARNTAVSMSHNQEDPILEANPQQNNQHESSINDADRNLKAEQQPNEDEEGVEEGQHNQQQSIERDLVSQDEREGEAEYCEYQDQDEEEGQNKYKDLSRKLETALKKISSSKNGFQQFNSFNQSYNSNVLLRFDEYQRKRQKQLQQKRQQEQNKKRKQLQPKPLINQKSRKIMEQVSQKPIYQRFDKIVETKKKKIQENEELKKAKEEEEYEKFLQEFNKHQKRTTTQTRDSETYFNDMVSWKQKIQQRNKEEKERKDQKAKEKYSFTPALNKKSVRMLKNQARAPIQDREIQRPKTEQPEGCTFHPKINKRILK